MPIAATGLQPIENVPFSLTALATSDGCGRHRWIDRLAAPQAARRDLADAIHSLCAVHGRHPSVFDDAARRRFPEVDYIWLNDAATAFVDERAYLARLTAAVGPLPSTPGQAESDSAFAALRHTFDMLATSERAGCAAGAAVALVIDWRTFRQIFDGVAERLGVQRTDSMLPADEIVTRIGQAPGVTPGVLRAMRFGAQQAFAQHRGLLDLIEARAIARDRL